MNAVVELLIEACDLVIVELLIRGPGWLVVRLFRRSSEIDFDGYLVFFTGLGFWMFLVAFSWGIRVLF